MGESNLAQAATKQFWVDPIYCHTRTEASQLSLLYDNKGLSRAVFILRDHCSIDQYTWNQSVLSVVPWLL